MLVSMTRKIPSNQEPDIALAYLAGASASELAEQHDVSTTTIKHILKRQGASPRPVGPQPPKAGTPEFREQVIELRKSGMRVRDITRRMKSATTTVSALLIAEGLLAKHGRGGNSTARRKIPPSEESAVVGAYQGGESMTQIAKRYGCSSRVVSMTLERLGIQKRRRGGVSPYTSDLEFITKVVKLWKGGLSQDAVAGELGCSQSIVSRILRAEGFDSGATRAKGARHGRWKGGRLSHPDGYVLVHMPTDHPFAQTMRNTHGYILEHRLVMAEHLGRPLTRNETVHHINGDKTDNRLDNLQLRKGRHGKHARYRCADCGSHNVVAAPL